MMKTRMYSLLRRNRQARFCSMAVTLVIGMGTAQGLVAQEQQASPQAFPDDFTVSPRIQNEKTQPLPAPSQAPLRTAVKSESLSVEDDKHSSQAGNQHSSFDMLPEPTLIGVEDVQTTSSQPSFGQFQKPLSAPPQQKPNHGRSRVVLTQGEDPFHVSPPPIQTGPPEGSIFDSGRTPPQRLSQKDTQIQQSQASFPEPGQLQIPGANELPALGEPAAIGDLPEFEQSPPQSANVNPPYSPPVEQRTDFAPNPRGSVFDAEPGLSMRSNQTAGTNQSDAVTVHEVLPGENYWTISRQHFGSARYFAALAEYNRDRIPRPDRMKPGMFVLIPDVEVLEERYPEITWASYASSKTNEPTGFFIDENGLPAYRIGKGDTLTDIAQSHLGSLTRWTEIHQLNAQALGPRGTLKIGMVLQLPADACQVSLAPPIGQYR